MAQSNLIEIATLHHYLAFGCGGIYVFKWLIEKRLENARQKRWSINFNHFSHFIAAFLPSK